MTTEVESGKTALNNSEDELKYLENEYKKLHDEAQRLLSERVHLENDITDLKKRASRLDEEVRILNGSGYDAVDEFLIKEIKKMSFISGRLYKEKVNSYYNICHHPLLK